MRSLKKFLLPLLSILISCQKDDTMNKATLQKPSNLSILLATKTDLNKFRILFEIKTDSVYSYDDYGLVISKKTFVVLTQQGNKVMSYGKLEKVNTKQVSLVLDSLEGNSEYHIRVFAKKGNHDYLSEETIISTTGLRISGIQPFRKEFYATRGEYISLFLNIKDSTANDVETKVSIGGVETKVIRDFQDEVYFMVPTDITSGKQSIEISRKGVSLFIKDTLEILKGKWSDKGNFPYPFHYSFGFAQVNDVGYMIGGVGATSVTNDFFKYDLISEKWSSGGATFLKDNIMDPIALAANNKLYVLPGQDTIVYGAQTSTKTLYEFDPALNTWVRKAKFPGDARIRSAGFSLNNKIYILGGFAGAGYPATDLWEYDPLSNSWKKKADFPGTSVIFPAVFAYNNTLFIFGGFFPSSIVTDEFWQYDLVADKWTQLPLNAEIHERYKPTYFTIGNKGYMFGGAYRGFDAFGATENVLNDAWELNMDTGKWTRISNNLNKTNNTGMPFFNLLTYAFVKGNTATVYDGGKMYQFIPE